MHHWHARTGSAETGVCWQLVCTCRFSRYPPPLRLAPSPIERHSPLAGRQFIQHVRSNKNNNTPVALTHSRGRRSALSGCASPLRPRWQRRPGPAARPFWGAWGTWSPRSYSTRRVTGGIWGKFDQSRIISKKKSVFILEGGTSATVAGRWLKTTHTPNVGFSKSSCAGHTFDRDLRDRFYCHCILDKIDSGDNRLI